MNRAQQFDMISRTVVEELPDCVFYDFDERIGYKVEFFGSWDELCRLPIRMDITIQDGPLHYLIGDARQVELHKNGKGYIAEYHAYAIHRFEDKIPI